MKTRADAASTGPQAKERGDEVPPRRNPNDFMDRQIGYLLRRTYVLTRKNTAEQLAPLGDVSPVQASAVITLASGALRQAELGRRIEMEPANTHSLVKRLNSAGFTVTQLEKGTGRQVALTEAGYALAARLAAILPRSTAATLAPLTAVEREQLFELLRKIANFDASLKAGYSSGDG